MDFELLAERYAAHADVVRRAGRTHPAAIEPRPDVLIRLSDGDAPVDGALQAGGEAHLARVRARVPWMYDGAVLALDRIEGAVVHVRRCGYFDRIRTGDALVEDPRQRARAEELAGPDPLRCGVGRAAALGVSAACTVRVDGGRAVVLGRRGGMPIDAGGWHVVPSGMLEEPDPRAAIAAELREELGVEVDPSAFVVTGLGWDLLRLIPEVCFRIDLDVDGADLRPDGEEHDELRLVPLDGLDAFWAAQPPGTLTAPGVAALALAGL